MNSASSGTNSVINQGSAKTSSNYATAGASQTASGGGKAWSNISQDDRGATNSGYYGTTGSTGNLASVTQIVSSGTSGSAIYQSGSSLSATVNQGNIASASNVSSNISQTGTGLTASVSQNVNGAQSVINQNGTQSSGTGAIVRQSAGQDFSGSTRIRL